MDFRSVSKSSGTRLAVPSTNVTPQLEDYDLLRNFRAFQISRDEPFHLVLNIACVKRDELVLTFPEENVLQVQLVHSGRDVGGVLFARDCVYKFALPNDVSTNPLTALWTQDDYLIVVESFSIADSAKAKDSKDSMDLAGQPVVQKVESTMVLKPKKVKMMFKPSLSQTVLRQSIEHAVIGLSHVQRIVQKCCFTCNNSSKQLDLAKVEFVKPLDVKK